MRRTGSGLEAILTNSPAPHTRPSRSTEHAPPLPTAKKSRRSSPPTPYTATTRTSPAERSASKEQPHRGALSGGGSTIAVLASRVNRAYPSAHTELFERIRQNGVLVSENATGVSLTRQRFLDRARVPAAFSDATVTVEAGVRAGAMVTANEARDIDRFLCAVPGSVMSAASYGPNLLLQQGWAHAVTDAVDIRELAQHGQITRTSPRFATRAPEATQEPLEMRTL
nr:DNA-processing protein DprA [Gulosibacter bifidus]